MMTPGLSLIDIHEPAAPSWWPPAPGWWLVSAAVLLFVVWLAWRCWHRIRRRRACARAFDDAVAAATTRAGCIAAVSGLLRRASRRIDPEADRLQGEEWLRFLDEGLPQPVFRAGPGRVLLDGGFRRDADDVDLDALLGVARARFLDWMTRR